MILKSSSFHKKEILTLQTFKYDGLKLCDHSLKQWASSIQANAKGGKLDLGGKIPVPKPPDTKASGDTSKTAIFPSLIFWWTFCCWSFVILLFKKAPGKHDGRLDT